MAITFYGVSSAPSDNGSQAGPGAVAVTPPASMAAGDLVVVYGTYRRTWSSGSTERAYEVEMNNGANSLTEWGGQDWNCAHNFHATDIRGRVWFCRFNGTWSADPAWRIFESGGTEALTLVMVVFRPSDAANHWACRALRRSTFSAGTTCTVTGMTTEDRYGSASHVAIAAWAIPAANTWSNLSGTGWSKTSLGAQYRNTTGSDTCITLAYQIQTSSAATNDVSQDQSASTAGAAFFVYFSEIAMPAADTEGVGTFVQSANKLVDDVGGTQTTITATFAGAVGDGNTVVVYTHCEDDATNANYFKRVYDDQGNTYYPVKLITDQAFEQSTCMWFCPSIANAPTQISVEIATINSFAFAILCVEYEGGFDFSRACGYRFVRQDGFNPETAYCYPAVTPDADGALLVLGTNYTGSGYNGDGWREISPFTERLERRDSVNQNNVAMYDKLQSTASSQQGQATAFSDGGDTSGDSIVVMGVFLPFAVVGGFRSRIAGGFVIA